MPESVRSSFRYRGTRCMNCDHPLDTSDKYCPFCSQLNSTKKLKFIDLFDEFFSSIISYDSKFRQTLRTLAFKPGRITSEFVSGKRMKYSNPFRFYLSVSVIFFLLQGMILKVTSFYELKQKEVHLDQIITDLNNDTGNTASSDSTIFTIKPYEELQKMPFIRRTNEKIKIYNNHLNKEKEYVIDSALVKLHHPPTLWNKFLYKKVADGKYMIDNPNRFFDFIRSSMPAIAFFFLPVFAFVIWLIYSKKKYNYMDHLVFTFHTQTMLFILMILMITLDLIIPMGFLILLLMGYFGFYLYKSLRNFYGQSRLITMIKFVFLNSVFGILLIFGSIFAFLGSFLLF